MIDKLYDDDLWSEIKRDEDNFIDLYFRFLSACRDYPYAEHSPPRPPAHMHHWGFVATDIRTEFRRSNPGFNNPELRWGLQ